MENFKSTEALLSWIVNFFAQKFGNSAILKGGMSLRLMHSPRYTNQSGSKNGNFVQAIKKRSLV